jgi:hypothetical protein
MWIVNSSKYNGVANDSEVMMSRKYLTILSVILFSYLASACAGGTSGSVRSTSQSCTNLGGTGSCDGRIGKLSGTYGIDIEDEGISPSDLIQVELNVTVEVGTVRVFFEGADGELTSAEVNPGLPMQIAGNVIGEFDGFEIGFEALGEPAEGITYSLSYAIQ